MVAVRALFATLNGLAYARMPSRSRARRGAAESDRSAESWYEGVYAHAGDEPPLEELLHDPVVHLVMRADRWDLAQVRQLLSSRQWPIVP
jgi:hypothetical protein